MKALTAREFYTWIFVVLVLMLAIELDLFWGRIDIPQAIMMIVTILLMALIAIQVRKASGT